MLGHKTSVHLTQLFSKVVVSFCISTASSLWAFQWLRILVNTLHCWSLICNSLMTNDIFSCAFWTLIYLLLRNAYFNLFNLSDFQKLNYRSCLHILNSSFLLHLCVRFFPPQSAAYLFLMMCFKNRRFN